MDIINYTEEHGIFRDTMRRFVTNELIPHADEWERPVSFPGASGRRWDSRDSWGPRFPRNTAGREPIFSIR